MRDAGRILIGPAAELTAGSRRQLETPDGRAVAVFATEAGVIAIEDRCPHRGAPLHDGRLEGQRLTCRHHGQCFVLGGGPLRPHERRLRSLPLVEQDGLLYLELPEPPA